MPAADLRRIHAITDNFFFWQGYAGSRSAWR